MRFWMTDQQINSLPISVVHGIMAALTTAIDEEGPSRWVQVWLEIKVASYMKHLYLSFLE